MASDPFSAPQDAAGHVASDTVCFAVLRADVTGNRATDIFDLLAARNEMNKPVSTANFRADVTADGNLNVFDLLMVRNSLNRTTGTCP